MNLHLAFLQVAHQENLAEVSVVRAPNVYSAKNSLATVSVML